MSASINKRLEELQAILAPCCDGTGSRVAFEEALRDLAMGTDHADAVALCSEYAESAPKGEGPRTRAQFVKLARKHLRTIAATDVFAVLPSASASTDSSNETSINLTESTDLSSVDADYAPAPEPYYVARSHEAARHIVYLRKLPFAARFELARLVGRGIISWPDVPLVVPDLRRSASPNVDGLKAVDAVLAAAKAKVPARWAWANRDEVAAELDREHAAFADVEAVRRGFGMALGTFDGSSAWYGGKLQLSSKLRYDRSDQSIDVSLNAIGFGPSCHLTRRFGSASLLRVRLDKDKSLRPPLDALAEFACRPLVIFDRVYRMLTQREDTLIYIATNEPSPILATLSPVKSRANEPPSLDERYRDPALDSLLTISAFFGAPALNGRVRLSKWASRFALALSPTIPIARLQPDEFEFVEDIVDRAFHPVEIEAPTSACHTDGVCYVSAAILRMARDAIGLHSLPIAIQGRVLGSKGLWTLSLEHEGQRIGIRPSQRKITLDPTTCDGSHLVLNLVKASTASHPARVGYQLLPLLAHGGVPASVLTDLQAANINGAVDALMSWQPVANETASQARLRLHKAIYSSAGVLGGRLRRLAGAAARTRGFGTARDPDAADEADDSDGELDGADFYGGYSGDLAAPAMPSPAIALTPGSDEPRSMAEFAIQMLEAGWDPSSSELCLLYIVRAALERKAKNLSFLLPIPSSVSVFCAIDPEPDSPWALQEGEAYVSLSNGPTDDRGLAITTLDCEALILRNPSYLTTDIRKVTLVDRPHLRHYRDVILFSARGERSQASYLSGGDCDGDRVVVIWDPRLVEPFDQSTGPLDAPFELSDVFTVDTQTVESFFDAICDLDPHRQQTAIQRRLALPLTIRDVTGHNMHFKASWLSGSACPDAVELAHKAACALDAPKLGLVIRPDVLRDDAARFDRATQMPWTWHACTGREINEHDQRPHAPERPQHILAILDRSSRKVKDAALARAHAAADAVRDVSDPDLSRKWTDAQQLYADDPLAVVDLEAIATSVRAAIEAYGRAGPRFGPDSPRKPTLLLSPSKKRKREAIEDDGAQTSRVTLESLAVDFAAGAHDRSSFQSSIFRHMSSTELALLRASALYTLGERQRRLPFDLAFGALVQLKSQSLPEGHRIVRGDVYAGLVPDNRFTRIQ